MGENLFHVPTDAGGRLYLLLDREVMARSLWPAVPGTSGVTLSVRFATPGWTSLCSNSLVAGHREAVPDVRSLKLISRDREVVRETIRRYGVTSAMHFAAFLAVGESVQVPARYYINNVAKTLTLLETLVEESVGRFVFSSTAAVFGEPRDTPIREDHPLEPINAYGETKLAVERALPHFAHAYGFRSVSLRYFNAAGADPSGAIGEDHSPEIHLIPRALAAVFGGSPVEIYGDDYATPDGTCVRDYVHVCDLADAHLRALRGLEAGTASGAYNLGNGAWLLGQGRRGGGRAGDRPTRPASDRGTQGRRSSGVDGIQRAGAERARLVTSLRRT